MSDQNIYFSSRYQDENLDNLRKTMENKESAWNDIQEKIKESERLISEAYGADFKLSEDSLKMVLISNGISLDDEQRWRQEMLKERNVALKQGLLINLGISFSSRLIKDRSPISLADQLEIIKNQNLREFQIDLRSKNVENVRDTIKKFRMEYESGDLSFHASVPQVDKETFDLKNKEDLRREIDFVLEMNGGILTIHPPRITQKVLTGLPYEKQELVVNNYCFFIAESIKRAINMNKYFVVAVENSFAKGEEGKWGQDVLSIRYIIERTANILEKKFSLPREMFENKLGFSFNARHALFGSEDKEVVVRRWFDSFKNEIKCLHIYTPSAPSERFNQELALFLRLYKEYDFNVPIYLESKQLPMVTEEIFLVAKNNSEIKGLDVGIDMARSLDNRHEKDGEIDSLLNELEKIYMIAKEIKEKINDDKEREKKIREHIEKSIVGKNFDQSYKDVLVLKVLEAESFDRESIVRDLQAMAPQVGEMSEKKTVW